MPQIESTLARLSEMVGRRLREHGLSARTVQLKLRYSDFSTITRAHSLAARHPVGYRDCSRRSATLFRAQLAARAHGAAAGRPRLGVGGRRGADGPAGRGPPREMEAGAGGRRPPARPVRRIGRLPGRQAMRGNFKERTHENPAGLPGKKRGEKRKSATLRVSSRSRPWAISFARPRPPFFAIIVASCCSAKPVAQPLAESSPEPSQPPPLLTVSRI